MCLLLVDKGIKPEEIIKCVNTNSRLNDKIDNYDFSEDSEEEIEKLENEVFSFDDRKKGKEKAYSDDTENDSDLIKIAKEFETENIFDSNHSETLRRLKKFFGKNRKKLINKHDENRINLSNSINTVPHVNQTSIHPDSSLTVQNDITLLNKKRNKN